MRVRHSISLSETSFHEALDVLAGFLDRDESCPLAARLHGEEPTAQGAELILPVPDADATTEAEMKPYAEPHRTHRIEIEMVPIPGRHVPDGKPRERGGPQRR